MRTNETAQPGPSAESAAPLAPAGIASRLGKATVGFLQLDIVYEFATNPEIAIASGPIDNPSYYVIAALAICLLPWTVNLGFNRNWGRRPLVAAGSALAVAGLLSLAIFASWWAAPVSLVVYALCIYVHGHMGASHVLAAILGTPGCEMRAPAQLLARLRGNAATFVACPGFWTPLDNWEWRFRHRHA